MTELAQQQQQAAATATPAHGFHRLRVAAVRELTPDAIEISLQLPAELADTFAHEHGQHLTLRVHTANGEVRRNYSITTPRAGVGAGARTIEIGVKHVPGGRASSWLTSELAAGDELEVMAPSGRFTAPLDPRATGRHWLLVAAGSGITPVLSIARSVLRDEPGAQVTLLYCNRGFASIMYRDELDALKSQHLSRLSLLYFLSQEKRNLPLLDGRITPERLRMLTGSVLDLSRVDESFICGPEQMAVALRGELLEQGVAPARVHVELFEVAADANAAPPPPPAADAEVVCRATVRLNGLESPVNLTEGERVLDAARRAGIDVPFACTSGVCATCRAHVDEGAVAMVANHALDDGELAAGFVLTCQSVPTTPELRVDYDHR